MTASSPLFRVIALDNIERARLQERSNAEARMTSRSIPFELVNVFLADKQPYTGNPLAVFRNGGELTTEQCQALGRRQCSVIVSATTALSSY